MFLHDKSFGNVPKSSLFGTVFGGEAQRRLYEVPQVGAKEERSVLGYASDE